MKRLIRYVFPFKKNIVLIFFSHLLYSLFSVVSLSMVIPFLSVLFSNVTPNMAKPEFALNSQSISDLFNYYMSLIITQNGKITALITVAVVMVIFTFFSNFFRYMGLYLLAPIRTGLIRGLRHDTYKKLLILPLSFYAHERKGDIMNRMGSDVQEVEWSIVSMLQMLFRDPLLIICYTISLFIVSTKLTLITLVVLPIAGVLISVLGKKIKSKSTLAQTILGRLSSTFEETIGGLRIIKGYNAIEHASEKFKKENDVYYKLNKKIFIRTELSAPLVEVLAILCLMIVLFIGSTFILSANSGLTGELFVFYVLIFARLIPPAKSLVTCYNNIQKGLPCAERIYKIIDGDEKILEVDNPIFITEFKEKIEFKDVCFSYNENVEVLKHVNLTIEKGKNIAIVGHSGSGKSTLVDLLPRFYDYDSGQILIDGIESKLFKISDLREIFGIVNQDVILFNDTVYGNIAFGKEDVSREDVEKAAKIAHAHDFIMEMENGYDTVIGDRGTKLSGGQRQRLSIARAVLKNPQVLILDEATSALDTESEYLVQQALDSLLKDKTAIIIAHRLSTIRHADEILFMEAGRIIERGTHEELMTQKGEYYKFFTLQEINANN
ncbi:MAG: ABC transporter ATP-binding protein/permease [Bacteroidales bacterium]|nr:ABC transporter ATP-binding protein/permease [Bacteroidales bacterium]